MERHCGLAAPQKTPNLRRERLVCWSSRAAVWWSIGFGSWASPCVAVCIISTRKLWRATAKTQTIGRYAPARISLRCCRDFAPCQCAGQMQSHRNAIHSVDPRSPEFGIIQIRVDSTNLQPLWICATQASLRGPYGLVPHCPTHPMPWSCSVRQTPCPSIRWMCGAMKQPSLRKTLTETEWAFWSPGRWRRSTAFGARRHYSHALAMV